MMWWAGILIGAAALGVAVAWLLCMWCGVEKLEAGAAVTSIYEYWVGNARRAKGLPAKLSGAWWMSDNPGAELGASFEGAKVDLQRRTVSFRPGGGSCGDHMWTYDSSCAGWMLYFMDRTVFLYVFYFNEDWTRAEIDLVMFGLIPIPSCIMHFDMTENPDQLSWQRTTLTCGKPTAAGTYTLKKVIDSDGRQLPAFQEMMYTIDNRVPIQGQTVKTKVQLVPKSLCCEGPSYHPVSTAEPLCEVGPPPPAAACGCCRGASSPQAHVASHKQLLAIV